MDDSGAIRGLSHHGWAIRKGALAVVLTALAGCATQPGPGVATMSMTVPENTALVLPTPGTLSIVSVVQRQYTNAVEQQIALSTSAATPGQNFISIQAFGPAQTVARPAGGLLYKPVTHASVRGEYRKYVPGVAMQISSNFVRNSYGPFSYAYGTSASGDACLYGWQQIRSDEAQRNHWNALGMLQVRLRVCQSGASEKELVEMMYGYTVVGGFAGQTWNPYGDPAPVDSQIGGSEPLRVPLAETRTPVAVRTTVVRERAPVTRRVVEREAVTTRSERTPERIIDEKDRVVVPSPTGGATAAQSETVNGASSGGEAVLVPSPTCVTGASGTTTCE